jgi:hypothetical protein
VETIRNAKLPVLVGKSRKVSDGQKANPSFEMLHTRLPKAFTLVESALMCCYIMQNSHRRSDQ